jgi:hypothetical protein
MTCDGEAAKDERGKSFLAVFGRGATSHRIAQKSQDHESVYAPGVYPEEKRLKADRNVREHLMDRSICWQLDRLHGLDDAEAVNLAARCQVERSAVADERIAIDEVGQRFAG